MPILTYDFSNVVAFGAEHSNLKEITATAAAELGLALVPTRCPSRGSTRSDHFSFVRQGVPCIYLDLGTESFDKNENVRELRRSFGATITIKPSDDMTIPINCCCRALSSLS